MAAVLRPLEGLSTTKLKRCQPDSAVDGGQCDTKYVTFEYMLQGAFEAGKKKNVCLSAFEPARTFVHEGKYPLLGRTDHDVEHARS